MLLGHMYLADPLSSVMPLIKLGLTVTLTPATRSPWTRGPECRAVVVVLVATCNGLARLGGGRVSSSPGPGGPAHERREGDGRVKAEAEMGLVFSAVPVQARPWSLCARKIPTQLVRSVCTLNRHGSILTLLDERAYHDGSA